MPRPKKAILEQEQAPAHTGANFGEYGIYGELYNPDSVMAARGASLDVYNIVLRDDQVKSTFGQRIANVISREWFVEPGGESEQDQEAADYIKEVFENLDFDRITKMMMFGLMHGYAVAEIIYKIDGAFIGIDAVKVRDRSLFSFHKDGYLLWTQPNAIQPVVMPDRKFWVYNAGADHGDNPYGVGLAHWLYWPVFFKRGGMQSWLKFLDKYGAPTAKGEFPRSATDAEKTKLLEALRAISTDAGIIIPEGMKVELIEATRGGSATYAEMYDRMDAAISKIILTMTLTTQQGSVGSQALGNVHADIGAKLAKDDADSLCQTLNNGVIKWLTEWNFPNAISPKIWRRMEDEPNKNESAALDKILFDIGYKPTPEKILEVYGEGYEAKSESLPPQLALNAGNPPPPVNTGEDMPAPAEFAEGDPARARIREAERAQNDIAEAAKKLSEKNAKFLQERIDTLLTLLDNTNDFKSFSEKLKEMAQDEPDGAIVTALEQGAIAAKFYAAKVAE